MKRRLYFLLPDTGHTHTVLNDLEEFGVPTRTMHALARPGTDLGDLPVATGRQRRDSAARLETVLWDGNLAVFFVALAVLIYLAFTGLAWYWMLLPAAVMLMTFLAGVVFTAKVPNVHLSEFQDAMRHGEILLMVDVPVWRVEQVVARVHEHHPDAVIGGVGWHIDALHV